MTEGWPKLKTMVPHLLRGEIGLELNADTGTGLIASFTPLEMSTHIAAILEACGRMVWTEDMERLRPEDAPHIKLSAFRCFAYPGGRMAVFVALCGPVPIAFSVPLAGLVEALDLGASMVRE